MGATKTLLEGAADNGTDEPRTRVVGMKWVKLGEGKDPEFEKTLLLYKDVNYPKDDGLPEQQLIPAANSKDAHGPDYAIGFLVGIEVNKPGRSYKFATVTQEGLVDDTDFTHYAIPTTPK